MRMGGPEGSHVTLGLVRTMSVLFGELVPLTFHAFSLSVACACSIYC